MKPEAQTVHRHANKHRSDPFARIQKPARSARSASSRAQVFLPAPFRKSPRPAHRSGRPFETTLPDRANSSYSGQRQNDLRSNPSLATATSDDAASPNNCRTRSHGTCDILRRRQIRATPTIPSQQNYVVAQRRSPQPVAEQPASKFRRPQPTTLPKSPNLQI